MRRKEILSLKPTRPKTEGKVFTVQSLERILIMNYWEDEKLIGRYCCCCPFMLPYNYSGCLSQN